MKARVPEASVPTKSARGMKRRSGKTRTCVPRQSSTVEGTAQNAGKPCPRSDPDQRVERETDEPVLGQDPLELAVDLKPQLLRRVADTSR